MSYVAVFLGGMLAGAAVVGLAYLILRWLARHRPVAWGEAVNEPLELL